MAEPPPPPPPPPLPPPMGRGRGKVGKVWVPKSKFMEGSIPNPIRIPAPVIRYRPYFAGASTVGVGFGPYGYDYCYGYGRGYQCVRPPLPQLQPQVDVNGFVQNRGNVDMAQGQTALFGLDRRGTGVFHPLRVPVVNNNRASSSSNNRGRKNKQRAEASYQIRRSKNASKGNNDGSVKPEECHEHTPPPPEIDLPQEWTY